MKLGHLVECRYVSTKTLSPSLKDVGIGSGSVRSRSVGTRTSTVKTKDVMTEPLPVIMVSVGISTVRQIKKNFQAQVCPVTRATG